MSTRSTASELRKLEMPDLHREIEEKSHSAMKLRLGLQAGSEKDSSKYRALRKDLAVLNTILTEKKKAGMLKSSAKASTVPAPKVAPKRVKRATRPQ